MRKSQKIVLLSGAVNRAARRNSESPIGKSDEIYPICPACKSLLRDGICPNWHCDEYSGKLEKQA